MTPALQKLVKAAQREQGWTETRCRAAKVLFEEGYSASQIAKMIGGVSRNAVTGKAFRMGATRRKDAPRPTMPRPLRAPTLKAKPPHNPLGNKHRVQKATPPPKPAAIRVASNGARTYQMPAEGKAKTALPEHPLGLRIIDPGFKHLCCCKWPLSGEGAETRFCAAETPEGQSFCADHFRQAYQVRSAAQKAADEARAAKARAGKRRRAA